MGYCSLFSDRKSPILEKLDIKILKGTKTLKTLTVKMSTIPSGNLRSLNFKAIGIKRGNYTYCVRATDPFGNVSDKSCAALKVK